ncbi:MAG: hypothetical protein ABSA12_01585 [Verrucomicrobiia bacterium]|jgi:hypothetical protein
MVRETDDAKLTHVADGWKTLFRNEDLLIEEIPQQATAAKSLRLF